MLLSKAQAARVTGDPGAECTHWPGDENVKEEKEKKKRRKRK